MSVAVLLPMVSAHGSPRAGNPACDTARRAVSYSAAATPLAAAPATTRANAPLPCLARVTHSTAAGETHIVSPAPGVLLDQAQNVLGDGKAGSSTQAPVVLGLSTDEGRTWTATAQNIGAAAGSSGIDNTLYRDPHTGRLFWIVYATGSAVINTVMGISDDGGRTWRASSTPCCAEGENPRMLAAPPRVSTTQGYPDVLYHCTNTAQLGGLIFAAGARECLRSLDGGTTWDSGRILLQKPTGHFPECGGLGEIFDALDGSYPTADATGRLYLIIRCGPQSESLAGPTPSTAFLVRSDDEMATWTKVSAAPALPVGYGTRGTPSKEELRSDADGNLYLVRGTQDPTYALYVWVSTDHGVTWSQPRIVSLPGSSLAASPTWQIAVGRPGHLAVAYAGSTKAPPCDTSSTTCPDLSMYLVQSHDALSANPTYEGSALNTSKDHTRYSLGGSDFVDATVGLDGIARAVFPFGYVGWLGAPAAAPHPGAAHVGSHPATNPTVHRPGGALAATGLPAGLGLAALSALAGAALVHRKRVRA